MQAMKYKARIYADALVSAALDEKIDDKKLVVNFLKLLGKNQDFKKAKEIIFLTETLLLKKTGNKKVIIETARKIEAKNIVKSFIKKGDIVQKKITPGIVAGIKLTVNGEKQLDYSLQKKLNEIFK